MKQNLKKLGLEELLDQGNGYLPYRHDLGAVEYLALAIKEDGLLSPPIVWATGNSDCPYVIVEGRRRLAAIRLLKDKWRGSPKTFPLNTIMCSIVTSRLRDVLGTTARLRLDPAVCLENNRGDDAVLTQHYGQANGLTGVDVEQMVGISQSDASESKSFVARLSPVALELLRAGKIMKQDADELVRLADGPDMHDRQAALLPAMVEKQERVRQKRLAARKRNSAHLQ